MHPVLKHRALRAIAAAVASASAANAPLPQREPPQLVVMPPIIVPIVGSGRLDGALHLKLVLAATDAPGLARLTQRLPALRAASVAGAIEFSRLYASPRAPVNAAALRTALTTVLRAEDGAVADILIVEVSAAD